MAAYSNTMIIIGIETTATLLSALTYYPCRTPHVYDKLKEEIRSRYKRSGEVTSLTAIFPYLTAVIHEALRIFHPFRSVCHVLFLLAGIRWTGCSFQVG